jgi:hypothetical protein
MNKRTGQTKYNKHWISEQKARRDNLETEYFSSMGVTDKNKHLFTGKITKHNPAGINHELLRA